MFSLWTPPVVPNFYEHARAQGPMGPWGPWASWAPWPPWDPPGSPMGPPGGPGGPWAPGPVLALFPSLLVSVRGTAAGSVYTSFRAGPQSGSVAGGSQWPRFAGITVRGGNAQKG